MKLLLHGFQTPMKIFSGKIIVHKICDQGGSACRHCGNSGNALVGEGALAGFDPKGTVITC